MRATCQTLPYLLERGKEKLSLNCWLGWNLRFLNSLFLFPSTPFFKHQQICMTQDVFKKRLIPNSLFKIFYYIYYVCYLYMFGHACCGTFVEGQRTTWRISLFTLWVQELELRSPVLAVSSLPVEPSGFSLL